MSTNDRVEKEMGRCIHFTGIGQPCCKAGVRYQEVRKDHEAIPYTSRSGGHYTTSRSFPCLADLNRGGAICPKRETLTREEAVRKVEADEKESAMSLEALGRCSDASRHMQGGRGVVECPKCGGNLHWSKASLNGHIWGKCETPDCLAWMM